MPVRNQKITPYNSSASGLDEPREKAETVKVYSKTSNFKKSPTSDSLYKSLGGKPPRLPSNTHPWHKRGVKPSGVNYKPSQEYGSMHQTGKGKGVYTYGKAPGGKGENANPGKGSPDGRGRSSNANPSGGPSNTKGSNANMYPRISNRPGTNANPGKGQPDGYGRSSNALADAFKPKFSGKPAFRRA